MSDAFRGIHQTQVKSNLPKGKVGHPYGDSPHYIEENAPHTRGAAAKVVTISVDSVANDTEYAFTFENETISYTSAPSASKTGIADGLAAAFNANIVAYGMATAENDSDDVVITGRGTRGVDYSISEDDANLSLTVTTAAAESNDIEVGKAVFFDGSGGVQQKNPAVARDIKITVDVVEDATEYGLWLEVEDEVHEVSITSAGSASEDGIIGALETAIDNLGLDEIDGTSDTAPNPSEAHIKPGITGFTDFRVLSWSSNLAVTTAAQGESVSEVLAGLARYTYDTESDNKLGSDSAPFKDREHVLYLRRGRMYVAEGGSASRGDRVYMGTSGSEENKFFASDSSTRLPLPKSDIVWFKPNVLEITKGM